MRRLGRVAALALLATACATPPPRPATPIMPLPDTWEVRGRLAVTVADEAWHGTFAWRRAPDRQQVDLAGPFGQGGARLRETAVGATLDYGDGQQASDTDTEALLVRHFGWALPLRGLRFWIAGQADPARPATLHHDADGRVVGIDQDGWQVVCDRYREVDGGLLPHRLVLARETVEARLVIDAWRLGAAVGGGG